MSALEQTEQPTSMTRAILPYIVGFGLSVILTLAAYFLVVGEATTGWALILIVAGLAIVQLFVQLVFFLHLGRDSRPRWNAITLVFMLMVVVTIVFGSIWIMYNLNYNMGHGDNSDTDAYMMQQRDKGF